MNSVCIWLPLLLLSAVQQTEAANKLLVLMIDGLKWDYIKDDMPGFAAIKRGGVKADYTQPEFPSVTYTNWLSLLSGEYLILLKGPIPSLKK